MSMTINKIGFASARGSKYSTFAMLVPAVLIAWVILGPVIGILYEYHVVTQTWFQSVPASQQEAMRAAYFNNSLFNYLEGGVVWGAGIVILGIAFWRTRAGT